MLGVGALRDVAIPLGIAFLAAVVGGGGGAPAHARSSSRPVRGVVVAVAIGVAGWMTTRWSVGDGTIRLRTGVLSEKVTDVPLGRVQAIDTVHGPVQRMFGVLGVHVQTAGGGPDAEIKLPAVTPADVELLRAAIDRRGGVAETDAPDAERRL